MIRKLLLGLAAAGAASAVLVFVATACSTSRPGTSDGSDGGTEDSGPGPCPDLDFPATCPTPPPSWQTDVQPLIGAYCVQCHGPGGVAYAQVPLGTYAEVAANRTRSWVQIDMCLMPNTDASPPPLQYPTPAQRQTMVTWLDVCNAPDN